MRYNRLGGTGLMVSELCLGTMTFGGTSGMWARIGDLGQTEANALVARAFEAGINFIDTANVYGFGRSEEITGQALRDLGLRRDEVVLATKVLGRMGEGPNAAGASRKHILDQAEASLKRLGLDYVDLYQIHGVDPLTPVEETLAALDNLVTRGLARYIGVSNWPAWRVAKAIGISERRGLARVASLQSYYTVAGRDLEREIVPMLASEQVGLMVWSPLAGGLLSGKYARGANEGRRAEFDFPPVNGDRLPGVLEALGTVAERHGVSVARVALAWLLHQPCVTSVILGAKRPEQLDDNLGAADLELSAEDLATLDRASALPPEYPGWMIARQSDYRGAEPPRRA